MKKHLKINSMQYIIGGFLLVILLGTFLLMLPISSRQNTPTDFLSCLFTATSSVCVTGLVVVDTATHWSLFGQIIILTMIQIGGLGVIMIASIIMLLLGQKFNLMQKNTLQETLSLHKVGGVIDIARFIIFTTISIEIAGAILLFFTFRNDFPTMKAIWYSIFHSISAFCNAGFDLMGVKSQFSSLTYYHNNINLNVVVMFLIIVGGLGFAVWDDIKSKKLKFKKYTFQSKIVIVTTLLLIIIPAIYFYIFEFENYKGIDKILVSIFQSITPRTAGFNTVSMSEFSEVGLAITILLMLIGGSPGSTAGGMKTTTFAIMIISTIAVFRRKNEAVIFNKKIPIETVRNALTIFMMYLGISFVCAMIITKIENVELMKVIFETSSAIGTVGSTFDLTTTLSSVSRVIIIVLMFIGRVGGLTLIYAIIPSLNKDIGYLPGKITVG